jgi:hypothetical protein
MLLIQLPAFPTKKKKIDTKGMQLAAHFSALILI